MKDVINFRKLSMVCFVFILTCLCNFDVNASTLKETQLIRRVYLEFLHIPPSITELEWYIVYCGTEGYKLAVHDVIARTSLNKSVKDVIINHLLSKEYKESASTLMSVWQRDVIIRYQSGDVKKTVTQAEQTLITCALAIKDQDILDSIDFLCDNLISRSTTTAEANSLLAVYRQFSNEVQGLYAVLQCIKEYDDFVCK